MASVAAETALFIHSQEVEILKSECREKFTTGRRSSRLNGPINFQLCLLPVRPSVISVKAGITHTEAGVYKSRGAGRTQGGKHLKTGPERPRRRQQNIIVFYFNLSLTSFCWKAMLPQFHQTSDDTEISSPNNAGTGLIFLRATAGSHKHNREAQR